MTAPLTLEEIDTLAALLAKSTPGQWKVWACDVMADTAGDSDYDKATLVARTASARPFDADLIASAQRALPALLSMARRLVTIESALEYLGELESPHNEEVLLFRLVRDWRMAGEDAMHLSAGVVVSLASQHGWTPPKGESE